MRIRLGVTWLLVNALVLFLGMPASTVNLDSLLLVTPTTGPQRIVDAAGSPIDLTVTGDNDEPLDAHDPNDIFIAQGQSGPARLLLPDGTAPDMNAAVLTPYSLVTPPGVVRIA